MSSNTESHADRGDDENGRLSQLTGFQRDLLKVIAENDGASGQEILEALSEEYGPAQPINHGRLYPNLDTLVTEGYVEKGEIDRRTNSYALTPEGFDVLLDEDEWSTRAVHAYRRRDTSGR